MHAVVHILVPDIDREREHLTFEQIFARDVGCDRRQDHRHGHGDGTAGRTTAWVGQRVRIDPEAAARPILVTLTVWLPSTDTVLTVVVPPT